MSLARIERLSAAILAFTSAVAGICLAIGLAEENPRIEKLLMVGGSACATVATTLALNEKRRLAKSRAEQKNE